MENETNSDAILERKMALEEKRLQQEWRLRRFELGIQVRRLKYENQRDNTQNKGLLNWLKTPVGATVIAAVVALVGNFIVSIVSIIATRANNDATLAVARENNRATLRTTEMNNQVSIVLKAADSPSEDQRKLNLLFFADIKAITLPPETETKWRKELQLAPGEPVPPPSIGFDRLVPLPDLNVANAGLSKPTQTFMIKLLGRPSDHPPRDCGDVTNPRLLPLIVTENVGPFKIRGLKPAVSAVHRVLDRIRYDNPSLYRQVHFEGMLCCRAIRGAPTEFSAHSWGTAIDLDIHGEIPAPGLKTQKGIAMIAPLMHKEGFLWGPGESTLTSSIHFEVSKEKLQEWEKSGQLNP